MKKIFNVFILSALLLAIGVNVVFAQATSPNLWGAGVQQNIVDSGFANNISPQSTAVRVINILLSFLGIIAVILILWAGFLWMTAGGNEDNVGKAKKIMLSAVIGLLIILAAYGIVNWVLGTLVNIV